MGSEETLTETIIETVTSTLADVTSAATATATATAEDEFVPPVISISITTPLLYLGILVLTIIMFSVYHRRSKIQSLQKLSSDSLFFPTCDVETNQDLITPDSVPAVLYHDLKGIDAHEKMLKVALVNRAAESMRRIMKLKETEPSIMVLYTRGLIGDDSYKRYKIQAKLQDQEMMQVAQEAESFKQGWSRIIFANAQEVMMNLALRRRIAAIGERKETFDRLEVKGVEPILESIQKRVASFKAK